MKNALYIGSLLTLFACSGEKKSTKLTIADTIQATPTTNRTDSVGVATNTPVRKKVSSARAGTWTYEKMVDKTGSTVYKASIMSPDLLQFGFPYTGGSTATLTIRKRNSTTNVYLEVSNGQFNRSFQGGKSRIRFDNNPPVTYSFSAAENGRANIIFFDDEQVLIDRMKTARKMVIDVGFDNQGQRQIEFNTAALRWNH